MTRRDIIEKLREHGIEAVEKDCVKNGVVFEAIMLPTGRNIAPVIYTDELINQAERKRLDLEAVIEEVLQIYEERKDERFDVDQLLNREWMLEHLLVGFQRQSKEELVKRDSGFTGIEMYMYVCENRNLSETFCVKVTETLLESADVNENEAWDAAISHTCEDVTVESLKEVLEEQCGTLLWEENELIDMYIVSNRRRVHGASAVLNKKKLENLAKVYGVKQLVLLPSSVHEMLVVPYADEQWNIHDLSEMVKEVNEQQVAKEEQLADQAYLVTFLNENCVIVSLV